MVSTVLIQNLRGVVNVGESCEFTSVALQALGSSEEAATLQLDIPLALHPVSTKRLVPTGLSDLRMFRSPIACDLEDFLPLSVSDLAFHQGRVTRISVQSFVNEFLHAPLVPKRAA